jgi:hypothetical protein
MLDSVLGAVSWLDRVAATEQFWSTFAQVLAAVVIALILEGRKTSPEDVDEAEFLTEIKGRCERILVALGDQYPQAIVWLGVAQFEVSAAETPSEAVARTAAVIKKELGLSDQDPDLTSLAETRALVQERVSARRRRADNRLLGYGGRSAVPGILIALLFLLPGGAPAQWVTLVALVACAFSLAASLAVLLGRWDRLMQRLGLIDQR